MLFLVLRWRKEGSVTLAVRGEFKQQLTLQQGLIAVYLLLLAVLMENIIEISKRWMFTFL